jgi:hypothetical protein
LRCRKLRIKAAVTEGSWAARPQAFYTLIVLPSPERTGSPSRPQIFHIFMSVEKEPYIRKLRFILLALTLVFAYFLEGVRSFLSSRMDVRGAIASGTLAEGEGRGKVLASVRIHLRPFEAGRGPLVSND